MIYTEKEIQVLFNLLDQIDYNGKSVKVVLSLGNSFLHVVDLSHLCDLINNWEINVSDEFYKNKYEIELIEKYEAEIKRLLGISIEDIPLYINEEKSKKIVNWRLQIGR